MTVPEKVRIAARKDAVAEQTTELLTIVFKLEASKSPPLSIVNFLPMNIESNSSEPLIVTTSTSSKTTFKSSEIVFEPKTAYDPAMVANDMKIESVGISHRNFAIYYLALNVIGALHAEKGITTAVALCLNETDLKT